jgi:hypothetical protein
MRRFRRSGSTNGAIEITGDAPDGVVVRDAEESFVAALQESDTAVETIGDSNATSRREAWRNRRAIGAAGVLLAALALLVARRRR